MISPSDDYKSNTHSNLHSITLQLYHLADILQHIQWLQFAFFSVFIWCYATALLCSLFCWTIYCIRTDGLRIGRYLCTWCLLFVPKPLILFLAIEHNTLLDLLQILFFNRFNDTFCLRISSTFFYCSVSNCFHIAICKQSQNKFTILFTTNAYSLTINTNRNCAHRQAQAQARPKRMNVSSEQTVEGYAKFSFIIHALWQHPMHARAWHSV